MKKNLDIFLFIAFVLFISLGFFTIQYYIKYEHDIVAHEHNIEDLRLEQLKIMSEIIDKQKNEPMYKRSDPRFNLYQEINAIVTAYNTVEWQTDNSPCIPASGENICGRDDVVACPREIPLGTKVEILDKVYECHDRTASKYNGRFDISFDKDIEGALQFGKRNLIVKVYE